MAYNQRWEKLTRQKARQYFGDSPAATVFYQMIRQESGFDDDVVAGRRRSPAGATGIAQLMPVHWQAVNPLDPEAALDYAARLFASHLAAYGGDLAKAAAAYNAGPGAVNQAVTRAGQSWLSVMPDETKAYVRITLANSDGGKMDMSTGTSTSTSGSGRNTGMAEGARRSSSPYEASKQSILARIAVIQQRLQEPDTKENDHLLLTRMLDDLTKALENIARAEQAEKSGGEDITSWYKTIWGILNNAFGNDLGTARLLFDIIKENRDEYLRQIQSQVNLGKLDFDTAVDLVKLQADQQTRQLAYAVEGLGFAKFISDEQRKNALMMLPEDVEYQVGFEPGSAINTVLANWGLPPMVMKVARVPREQLDPMANLQRAREALEGFGVTRPEVDLTNVTAARERILAQPAYQAQPINVSTFPIPQGPDPSSILAAMFKERAEKEGGAGTETGTPQDEEDERTAAARRRAREIGGAGVAEGMETWLPPNVVPARRPVPTR